MELRGCAADVRSLASNHTFLKGLRIQRSSVLIAMFLLCVVCPTILVCMELAVRAFHRGLRQWLHNVLIAFLLVLFVLPLLSRVRFLPGPVLVMVALAIGAFGALLLRRFAWTRLLVSAACPAIIAFPGWLLFYSPVSLELFWKSRPMQVSVGNAAPVVLVVFDEFYVGWLLDDRNEINADRFPNFAALGQQATWFRNATAVHPFTAFAVPAILTGEYQTGDLGPDHGVSFRPNDQRRPPTAKNLPDLMHVPLFVKLPHQTSGAKDDRNAENVDILPTIADFLDITPRPQCDGESLLDENREEHPQKEFFDLTELKTVDADVQEWLDSVPPLVRRFRSPSGWDGVFRIVPHNDLLGHNASGNSSVVLALLFLV
jgi:hypothetical protein